MFADIERRRSIAVVESQPLSVGLIEACTLPAAVTCRKASSPRSKANDFASAGSGIADLVMAVVDDALRLCVDAGERVLKDRVEFRQVGELVADQRQAGGGVERGAEIRLIRRQLSDEVLGDARAAHALPAPRTPVSASCCPRRSLCGKWRMVPSGGFADAATTICRSRSSVSWIPALSSRYDALGSRCAVSGVQLPNRTAADMLVENSIATDQIASPLQIEVQ